MKRFHVHVAVRNLPASVRFYSHLFGMPPSKEKPDYAKWMLDEPRVNFAISVRGQTTGVDHFGFQAETPEELAGLGLRAEAASGGTVPDQGEAVCCYAMSEKHWTIDPQGIAWEHFLTMSEAPDFGDDVATHGGACCIPDETATRSGACCV